MSETGESSMEQWISVQTELTKLYVHDLKNPISALAANLSFLDTSDEEIAEIVGDCKIAVDTLLQMVEQLHLIAKLEKAEAEKSGEVEISTLLEVAVDRIARLIVEGPSLRIVKPLPKAALRCEPKYARLALEALIFTSVQNCPADGSVGVEAALENDLVRISVRDDGPVVEPRYRESLFSRDRQAAIKSATGARYGRALGLYAVGLAVDRLGWSVEAGEHEGRASFTIRIPPDVSEC